MLYISHSLASLALPQLYDCLSVNKLSLKTHWGRVTHICFSKLTIIGSDNGLPPERRQAIIWTNAGVLLIRTLGINSGEILSEIHMFSFKKMHLETSSKWRPLCHGLNVLRILCKNTCTKTQQCTYRYRTIVISHITNNSTLQQLVGCNIKKIKAPHTSGFPS